jgi:DNA-binding transcriptional LysR family regulator
VTVHPQRRFKADSAHVPVQAAVAGIGIVAMGELVSDPYVISGALVPMMKDYHLPPVDIYIVRPAGQRPARKVRVLIDLLAEKLASTKPR